MATAITKHGMDIRGIEDPGGPNERNFARCHCGERFYYNFPAENPWDKITDHIMKTKKENTPQEVKHFYQGTVIINGITYVKCGCTWKKKLRPGKDPRNVHEGHKGFEENREIKAARGLKDHQPTTSLVYSSDHSGGHSYKDQSARSKHKKVKQAVQGFWNGQSTWKKGTWDKIEPIAEEVFGGTFFVIPTKSK